MALQGKYIKNEDLEWAAAIEERIARMKRRQVDGILAVVFENNYTVNHFLPQIGCTVGQLAFYTCLRSVTKKNLSL
jgi:hypothetical protein